MKPDREVSRALHAGKDFGGFLVAVLCDLTRVLMGSLQVLLIYGIETTEGWKWKLHS